MDGGVGFVNVRMDYWCSGKGMNAMSKDTLNHYFDLLKETIRENNLLNSPTKVYNVDETGIPLDSKTPKIITAKGTKKVHYQSSGRKGLTI